MNKLEKNKSKNLVNNKDIDDYAKIFCQKGLHKIEENKNI